MNARIDVTPAGIAARTARIEAAARAKRLRYADMAAARDIRRKHGLRNLDELFLELNTLIAACNCGDDYKQRLRDLCSDMEDEMTAPAPDLPYSGRERGEFDGATVGVRGRA